MLQFTRTCLELITWKYEDIIFGCATKIIIAGITILYNSIAGIQLVLIIVYGAGQFGINCRVFFIFVIVRAKRGLFKKIKIRGQFIPNLPVSVYDYQCPFLRRPLMALFLVAWRNYGRR